MDELELRKENDEVYYLTDRFRSIGPEQLRFLKKKAAANTRRRCRLCLHGTPDDPLHQMIIAFQGDAYFRPLRHLERPQSFQLIEGSMRLALLDDDGNVTGAIDLAAGDERFPFIARIAARQWYAFILKDEWFIFHEITTGPLSAGEREYAPFAPAEEDPKALEYALNLRERVLRLSV